ncbi:MAG: hypothetical protein KF894_18210 [Labilithrix sp.]|nr:hypothetical protein [Labilithrix sp.]
MGIVLLVVVIAAIVLQSRQARRHHLVRVPHAGRAETWTFDVREMSAELHRTETSKFVGLYELRRVGDGRWEIAEVAGGVDEALEPRAWLPCDPDAADAIEAAHRRYNGVG